MDNTETMAPVTESAPTETSAPVESSKGDQVEATMSAVFDKMNPTGETDGRTPPEAAQYGKDYETSPESEQVQALEDEQAQGLDTPQAWGKKALGIWNGMSDEAKEFVMHRERESTQKITELGQAARDAKVMAELFDSHREFIPQVQADGRPMTQAAAFETLLSVDPS